MFMTALFCYGTLKQGYWNHDRFCSGAVEIQDAWVRGKLYELPSGIPVLHIPQDNILAVGTRDISADVDVQEQHAELLVSRSWELPEEQNLVHGELLTFDHPTVCLPPIDHLEGFNPGRPSLYHRVLTPVFTDKGTVAAWVYVTDSEEHLGCCRRLENGRWEHGSRTR